MPASVPIPLPAVHLFCNVIPVVKLEDGDDSLAQEAAAPGRAARRRGMSAAPAVDALPEAKRGPGAAHGVERDDQHHRPAAPTFQATNQTHAEPVASEFEHVLADGWQDRRTAPEPKSNDLARVEPAASGSERAHAQMSRPANRRATAALPRNRRPKPIDAGQITQARIDHTSRVLALLRFHGISEDGIRIDMMSDSGIHQMLTEILAAIVHPRRSPSAGHHCI